MSDTSNLTQLARFVGQAAAPSTTDRQGITGAMVALAQKPRRVIDLLGAVLALSARTRRMVLPPVAIDLDVFSPEGNRAVRIVLPGR